MNNFCIITTINKPTKAIEQWHEKFGKNLIVVGDEKTPLGWSYKDAQYILDLPEKNVWYEGYAPANHYARKNLGYLEAMRRGADVIYSTDDDNSPNENWKMRLPLVTANESLEQGWYNVYRLFSSEYIWARGFSLRHLGNEPSVGNMKFTTSSIQQGLADGEPDVDAIWRLVFQKQHVFDKENSVLLRPNTWCPINSQSTWFFPKAFPLLYLPVTVTMRCTDIWSGFIAQRCLWELGEGITFHSPAEVFQDRNKHDLIKDLADEVPGYLKNDLIIEILQELELKKGEENVCENLLTCYIALANKDIVTQAEIRSVKSWIKAYENIASRK